MTLVDAPGDFVLLVRALVGPIRSDDVNTLTGNSNSASSTAR
ncbi:hypothetical protein [Marisediminicola antarctica]|nr:hypothetical protein [Marisediminicola antarctica]